MTSRNTVVNTQRVASDGNTAGIVFGWLKFCAVVDLVHQSHWEIQATIINVCMYLHKGRETRVCVCGSLSCCDIVCLDLVKDNSHCSLKKVS